MTQATQLLTDALGELTRRGHTKGRYMDRETGALCAVGAIHMAVGSLSEGGFLSLPPSPRYDHPTIWAAHRYLNEASPLHNGMIQTFNDAPATTAEDVMLVFKNAIALSEDEVA